MLNKNDPLIGVVQEVMNRNHAEREATKLVNEKFGIQDRKVLPHERQHEWEEVYNTVLNESKSLAALAPPNNKVTEKDRLVGAGVLKKHPTQPGKHVLAKQKTLEEKKLVGKQPNIDVASSTGEKKPDGKLTKHDFEHLRSMEEDVTSPSRMGINKPDYAPPGTTPDYAKSKEQTVNRAAKTSLPPGTVAKSIKEAVYSGGMKPTNTRSTNYGGGNVNQAGSGSGASGMGSQVMGQSTYSSGAAGQQPSVSVTSPKPDAKAQGYSVRPGRTIGGGGRSDGNKYVKTPDAINNLTRGKRPPGSPTGAASGLTTGAGSDVKTPVRTNPGTDKLNAATSAAAKQNPTVSGTRFGGASTYQAKTAAAAKPMGAGAAGQQVGAPAAKPMGAGAAGQQVGAPKAPIPKVKPAGAATAKKVTPVRKAGAPAGATKPAKKLPPLQQQMKRSRYNRDGGNVGPGSS